MAYAMFGSVGLVPDLVQVRHGLVREERDLEGTHIPRAKRALRSKVATGVREPRGSLRAASPSLRDLPFELALYGASQAAREEGRFGAIGAKRK